MAPRISEGSKHDKRGARFRLRAAERLPLDSNKGGTGRAAVSANASLRATVQSLITRSQKEQNVAVCRPSLTATVLGICLLFGQGFRAPNFAFESFGRSLKNYITSLASIDAAFTSAERLVRVQNKAPRRQMSFGAVPPNSMLEVPA